MKRQIGIAITLTIIALYFSCNNSPSKEIENASPPNQIDVQQPAINRIENPLDLSDALSVDVKMVDGKPESTITIKVKDKQEIITEPLECQIVAQEDFSNENIPVSADAGCKCWWAGAGADYMVRQRPEGVTVWKRLTDESPEATQSAWLWIHTF